MAVYACGTRTPSSTPRRVSLGLGNMADAYRHAAPTTDAPAGNRAGAEGVYDPHNMQWVRTAPPYRGHLFAAGDFPLADTTTFTGAGGRRASGFRVPAADPGGVLTFKDGSGTQEAWTLAAGEGDAIEISAIVSWTGTNIRVYW